MPHNDNELRIYVPPYSMPLAGAARRSLTTGRDSAFARPQTKRSNARENPPSVSGTFPPNSRAIF
ncbi:hypothetical protein JYU34_011483 [Plutella xylostella]|uniref:Uncharacterized protein n=1 Tax=Plutella xylostella TaxID=51655 RepID=A0ABQ7QIC1_PLUXY|nr:hypothetical protein JYU34_011483 [Plutella xylostella]